MSRLAFRYFFFFFFLHVFVLLNLSTKEPKSSEVMAGVGPGWFVFKTAQYFSAEAMWISGVNIRLYSMSICLYRVSEYCVYL